MRKFLAATVAVLMIAGLAGCDPSVPDPTPSPTITAAADPTPTPTPTPTTDPNALPAFIVVNAASVSVGAVSNLQLIDIPYTTDAATAAAQLSELLGIEPTVSTSGAAGICGTVQTVYDFGGFALWAPGSVVTAAGANFNAVLTSPTGAGTLALETIYGQAVGSTIEQVLETVPDAVLQSPGGGPWITMGRVNPEESEGDAIGVIASTDGTVVTDIRAPVYLFGDC